MRSVALTLKYIVFVFIGPRSLVANIVRVDHVVRVVYSYDLVCQQSFLGNHFWGVHWRRKRFVTSRHLLIIKHCIRVHTTSFQRRKFLAREHLHLVHWRAAIALFNAAKSQCPIIFGSLSIFIHLVKWQINSFVKMLLIMVLLLCNLILQVLRQFWTVVFKLHFVLWKTHVVSFLVVEHISTLLYVLLLLVYHIFQILIHHLYFHLLLNLFLIHLLANGIRTNVVGPTLFHFTLTTIIQRILML